MSIEDARTIILETLNLDHAPATKAELADFEYLLEGGKHQCLFECIDDLNLVIQDEYEALEGDEAEREDREEALSKAADAVLYLSSMLDEEEVAA